MNRSPPVCQVPTCRVKLTTFNRYSCPRCPVDVCLAHRMADSHSCKNNIQRDTRLVSDFKKPVQEKKQQLTNYAPIKNTKVLESGIVMHNKDFGEDCVFCGCFFTSESGLRNHI